MNDQHGPRVEEVFCRVLRLSPEELHDEVRRGTLEAWDSLGHVALVGALNEAFGIQLDPERALSMHTLGDIKRIVRQAAGQTPSAER